MNYEDAMERLLVNLDRAHRNVRAIVEQKDWTNHEAPEFVKATKAYHALIADAFALKNVHHDIERLSPNP